MAIEKYKYAIAAAMLFLVSLIVYFSTGFYYDNPSDVNVNYVMNGVFSGQPLYLLNTTGGILYLSYIIQFFYSHFPDGHWTDFYMLGLNLTGFLLLFIIVVEGFLKQERIRLLSLILYVALVLVWVDAFVLVDITKVSFVLSFSALYYLSLSGAETSRRRYLICFTLFFVAALDRIEPAMLVFMLHLAFLILIKGIRDLKQLVSKHKEVWISPVLIVLVSMLVNWPITEADSFYKSIRPYQFAVWDFKYDRSELKLESKEDSAILRAVSNYFLADKSKINADFFKKINLKPQDKIPVHLLNYLKEGPIFKQKLAALFDDYLLRYWFLMAMVLVILAFAFSDLNTAFRQVLFFTIFFLMVLFVGVFFKMEYHVYVPLCSVFLSYLILPSVGCIEPNWRIIFGTALFLCFALAFCGQISGRYSKIKQEADDMNILLDQAQRNFNDKILVYNLSTFDKLKYKLFAKEKLPDAEMNLSVDNGWVYIYPEYEQYMKGLTGTSDYEGIMRFILSKKEDVVFLSAEKRMEVLKDYSENVYHLPFTYSSAIDDSISEQHHFWIKFYQVH